MVQFAGGVSAVQVRLVLVLVVPEAASPAGALGTAEQLAADVVTLRGELAAEVPSASVASTVKLYVVEAERPVTANDGLVEVPMEVPFCSTL
jgi:hypothetical protein